MRRDSCLDNGLTFKKGIDPSKFVAVPSSRHHGWMMCVFAAVVLAPLILPRSLLYVFILNIFYMAGIYIMLHRPYILLYIIEVILLKK